jgi:hypothetical protein
MSLILTDVDQEKKNIFQISQGRDLKEKKMDQCGGLHGTPTAYHR